MRGLGIRLLFPDRIRKLKKRYPRATKRQLARDLGRRVKKSQIYFRMGVAGFLIFVIVSGISFGVGSYKQYKNMMDTAAIIASQIIDEEDLLAQEEQSGEEWEWTGTGNRPAGSLVGNGGIYPKDVKLRLRAELMEILTEGTAGGAEIHGNHMDPAWIMGSIYRENGNGLYSVLDNSNIPSLFSDLIIQTPACGKGSSCKYTKAGISHYHGGSVVGGVDKGDPYTQIINTDKSIYDRVGGDHAIGILQFEIPYMYGDLVRKYGDTSVIITSPSKAAEQVRMDTELGFIRPNPLYAPDIVYNASIIFARKPANRKDGTKSDYDNIVKSSDFLSMSEENQGFVKFMYASAAYGRGHINSTDDKMALALIKAVKNGRIEKLDEMVINQKDKYWNSSANTPKGNWKAFIEDVNSRYGLGLQTTYFHQASGSNIMLPYWYGVYAANVGRVAWNEMAGVIEAAEKESTGEPGFSGAANGNWVGQPGSGEFGNTGSPYYVNELGIRWYHQSYKDTANGKNAWGSMMMNPSARTSIKTPYPRGAGYIPTLASGGCGIYTLAMVASNLLDKDITPDMARKSLADNDMVYALYDSAVPKLARNLGVQSKIISAKSSSVHSEIEKELRKGNMIVFISRGGPKPWYTGNGHYMALRGITEDGKYLGITSVGSTYGSAAEIMSVPVEKEIWRNSLSRDFVWVVGLNVD